MVLPYLPKETEDGVINVLDDDQEYIVDLAQFPDATPGSNFVAFLSRHDSHLQLVEAAREALLLNKTVVIQGYVDTQNFKFSMEGLYNAFQTSEKGQLKCHGAYGLIVDPLCTDRFSNRHANSSRGL